MRQQRLFTSSMVLIATLLVGCASNSLGPTRSQSDPMPWAVSQREASDLMFKYRQQAAELRAIASRYELEAQQFAHMRGEGDEQVQRSLANAKALWTAAEEADGLAREYQRAVPHGQLY
ncbi:MAG TPA: hypothetical protein VJM82_00765 [Nitrospiraceae bacterium]|nr:hypothetical protein [Nitrospiraceae bacterium]